MNSYRTRVLTDGMDIDQYNRNPVLLYMHRRGTVIGYMKDVKREGDDITGEPVFDEASEDSIRVKKQYEFGSIRMVSAGIDIIEMSDDPKYLLPGQKYETITKSKLFEVSIVDIGANDDAIALHRDGKIIELGKDGDCQLPLLNNNNQKTNEMDLKVLAKSLGLDENATEEAINAKIAELSADKQKADKLQQDNDALLLTVITAAVDTAILEKKIATDKRQQFIDLGKKIGVEELKKITDVMTPNVKLSAMLSHQGGAPAGTGTYKKLSEVPADELLAMRDNDVETYKKLYKAEYGMDCKIEKE